MSIRSIQDRLSTYHCQSALEEEHALREITQEVMLAGLARSNFFTQAGFHGGTCLRVFYGLNRFSEDLDFALRTPNRTFDLIPYLNHVKSELTAFGYSLEIQDRSHTDSAVKKAFPKDDSLGKVLELNHLKADRSTKKIRVKLEVDTNPPEGGLFESKYLDFPFVSSVSVHDPSSLFAGKLHALLCREYTKGRDWYDFIWYTSRRTPVNYVLLQSALKQQGPWQGQVLKIDQIWLSQAIQEKTRTIDWEQAATEVKRFVKPNELPSLKLWSQALFMAQANKLLNLQS